MERLAEAVGGVLLRSVSDMILVLSLAVSRVGWAAGVLWIVVYALTSWSVVSAVRRHRWILAIATRRRTRIVHGIEHATFGVCLENKLPVTLGFTHGPDRFVLVLSRPALGHLTSDIRSSAVSALDRMQRGETELAYVPGCGTNDVVSPLSAWLVISLCAAVTFAAGGSLGVFAALCIILVRVWSNVETGLGIAAQRRWTVSVPGPNAHVVRVRAIDSVSGLVRPPGETWFEVRLDLAAT